MHDTMKTVQSSEFRQQDVHTPPRSGHDTPLVDVEKTSLPDTWQRLLDTSVPLPSDCLYIAQTPWELADPVLPAICIALVVFLFGLILLAGFRVAWPIYLVWTAVMIALQCVLWPRYLTRLKQQYGYTLITPHVALWSRYHAPVRSEEGSLRLRCGLFLLPDGILLRQFGQTSSYTLLPRALISGITTVTIDRPKGDWRGNTHVVLQYTMPGTGTQQYETEVYPHPWLLRVLSDWRHGVYAQAVIFGQWEFEETPPAYPVWNPAVSDATVPMMPLRSIYIAVETSNQQHIERFLTFAVNRFGQESLKETVDVYISGQPEHLHPNLWNSVRNLCKSVHRQEHGERREGAI